MSIPLENAKRYLQRGKTVPVDLQTTSLLLSALGDAVKIIDVLEYKNKLLVNRLEVITGKKASEE